MQLKRLHRVLLFSGAILLVAAFLYHIPAVRSRLDWRLEIAGAYFRGVIRPIGEVPTPVASPYTPSPIVTPSANRLVLAPTRAAFTATAVVTLASTATPTPSPSPTPLPVRISLPAPVWEKQGWNNCGPASLALYLRFYGWEGDQYDISALVKPQPSDRNVNVEELMVYVWDNIEGLNADFRVGGDIGLLKGFLAQGIPIMIEEGMSLDSGAWPNDDRWAGHYLLLTGYDDGVQMFTGQDSYYGPDQQIPYETLDQNWRVFNRVYIMVYPPELEEVVKTLLGPHQDYRVNRQFALEMAEAEVERDPEDVYAWFNLGSNLVYFERHEEAALAFDKVRALDPPQRMWRYQFSPFLAYFHSNRIKDLLALTEYALQITEQSEEALLWRGWGRYRSGDIDGAVADFRAALGINAYYRDAQYALEYLGVSP